MSLILRFCRHLGDILNLILGSIITQKSFLKLKLWLTQIYCSYGNFPDFHFSVSEFQLASNQPNFHPMITTFCGEPYLYVINTTQESN